MSLMFKVYFKLNGRLQSQIAHAISANRAKELVLARFPEAVELEVYSIYV